MANLFEGMAEKLKSYCKIPAFKERLVVFTVSDFISAGDCLVTICPNWSWESGDLSKRKSYLPSHKQFMILKHVPCPRRAFSFNEVDDRWLLIHGDPCESKKEENLISTEELPKLFMKAPFQIISSYFGGDKKEEIPYVDRSNQIYPATRESTHRVVHDPEANRTYDVSITYDKDHQTPHFWLIGYHEDGSLLQPELILEDVRQNHAGKTVTIEDHPFLLGKHASVHPRVHGAALKKMVDDWKSSGFVPEVDKYLFLLLEFVSSVFPSIKHDCNLSFDLESQQLVKVWGFTERNIQNVETSV